MDRNVTIAIAPGNARGQSTVASEVETRGRGGDSRRARISFLRLYYLRTMVRHFWKGNVSPDGGGVRSRRGRDCAETAPRLADLLQRPSTLAQRRPYRSRPAKLDAQPAAQSPRNDASLQRSGAGAGNYRCS